MASKITPITQQRFMELAAEEDVPIEIAAGLYGMESSYGQNPRAFDFPADPTRRGVGSLQLIKSTFESVYPGVAYEDATDEDFTRAGLRNIKKAELPDGTYDIDKLRRQHFGAGFDPSFYIDANGKRQAKDPKAPIPAGGKRYQPSTDPAVLNDLAKYTDDFLWNRNIGNYTNPYKVADNTPKAPIEIQAAQTPENKSEPAPTIEEAQVRQASADAFNNVMTQWETRQKADQAAQNKALDQFGLNPYGNYGRAQELANALTEAQKNLQVTMDAASMAKPSGNILMDAIMNFGAKQILPQQTAQFKVLADSAKAMNDIARQFTDQAAAMGQSKEYLTAHQEARLTAAQSDNLTFRTQAAQNAEQRLANAQLAMGIRERDQALKEQAAEFKNAQTVAQTELAQARKIKVEAEASLAMGRPVKNDPETLAAMNDAGARTFQILYPGETNKFTPAKSMEDFMRIYMGGKTKDGKKIADTIRSIMGSGQGMGADEDIRAKAVVMGGSTSDAVVQSNLLGIAKALDIGVEKAKADFVAQRGKRYKDFDSATVLNSPQEKAAIEKSFYQKARQDLLRRPTQSNSFRSNPINIHSLPHFILLDPTSGIQKLLADNNMGKPEQIQELQSDDMLLSRLAYNLGSKNSPNSQPEVLDVLNKFYKQLAVTRANQTELKNLGLGIPANSYVITDGKAVWDLASRGGLEEYFTRIKKMAIATTAGNL